MSLTLICLLVWVCVCGLLWRMVADAQAVKGKHVWNCIDASHALAKIKDRKSASISPALCEISPGRQTWTKMGDTMLKATDRQGPAPRCRDRGEQDSRQLGAGASGGNDHGDKLFTVSACTCTTSSQAKDCDHAWAQESESEDDGHARGLPSSSISCLLDRRHHYSGKRVGQAHEGEHVKKPLPEGSTPQEHYRHDDLPTEDLQAMARPTATTTSVV
jgi:hypothetical protein